MTEHIYESAVREQIARQSPDSKKQLQLFSGQLFDTISQGLLQDGHVRIHQFGSFKLNWANERRGRHPKTGAPLTIPAQPRISFTPAKALKDQVNEVPVTNRLTTPASLPITDLKNKPREITVLSQAIDKKKNILNNSGKLRSEQSSDHIEAASKKASDKQSPSLVLNRKSALAASIIIALLAVLMLNSGDEYESPGTTASNTLPDNKTVLEAISKPKVSQDNSNSILTNNQQLASAQIKDIKHEAYLHIQPPDETATTHPADLHVGTQSSKPFFQEISHQLVDGDSLWRLSRKHYSNPFYWPHIYQVNQNKIDNPDKLKTGRIIQLPGMYGTPDELSPEDRRSIAEGYFLVYRYHKKTNRPFPYYALLGVNKFDPAVIQEHIYEIDEQDWHSLQLASN